MTAVGNVNDRLHNLASAQELDRDAVQSFEVFIGFEQTLNVTCRLAAKLDDQITSEDEITVLDVGGQSTAAKTGAVGGASLDHSFDQQPAFELAVEKASDLLIIKENTFNPYPDTIFQGQQLLGSVDGNSESQPLRPTRDRYDSRCNSDDFAVGVKNRTAAVTGVDGGI